MELVSLVSRKGNRKTKKHHKRFTAHSCWFLCRLMRKNPAIGWFGRAA